MIKGICGVWLVAVTGAGVAQLAEHQPSKLNVASSILVSRSINARLAYNGPQGFSGGAPAVFGRVLLYSDTPT